MFVSNLMTRNPVMVQPDTPVTEAQVLMRREHVHRLPVVDKDGKLTGIISEKDLLNVSPSVATTLDMYEMTNLLSKIKVEKVMTRKVLSVFEDTLVEEAARLMADHDIGGLPVVRKDNTVIAIITESDLFRLFIDLFGSRRKGLRMTLLIPQKQGELAALAGAIAAQGGNIMAIGTAPGKDPTNVTCMIKLDGVSRETAIELAKPLVIEIQDIREV
jgi:acetoin utilization protein AcuB